MLSEKETTSISKLLSLVLRHQPDAIGIELDENGWTDVAILLQKLKTQKATVNLEVLKYIVANNNKKRFSFNEDFSKIRANQGHSVEIDLGLKPVEPPEILFHGTAFKNLEAINTTGLEKQSRQHVHLSKDVETALKVGQRHGKPIVLEVLAGKMFKEGFHFFVSENGVWLTDHVLPKYLQIHEE